MADTKMVRLRPGDRVKVKGPSGFWHHGTYMGRNRAGVHLYAHNMKKRGEVVTGRKGFAGRRTVHLVRRPPEHEVQGVLRRARQRLGKPYNAITHNCEHTASFAQHGRTESPQLRATATKAALGLGLGYILVQSLSERPRYDARGRAHCRRTGRYV